jgi:hypothetical protein
LQAAFRDGLQTGEDNMPRRILEVRSRTVNEAIDEGLDRLQLSKEEVTVKVLEEPARVLGFSSDAVVWLVYDSAEDQAGSPHADDIADEEIETIDGIGAETDETGKNDSLDGKTSSADSSDSEKSQRAAENGVADSPDTTGGTGADSRSEGIEEQSVELPSEEVTSKADAGKT